MESTAVDYTENKNFNKSRVLKLASKAYEKKEYEEATNYFTELILKSEQQDVEWFIKRCDCYQHLNMDTEAMLDANMVVKLHPESYKGYSLLGMLHQIQGHYDEALFCYFDCLEILWLRGTHVELPNIAEKCLDDIMRSARPVAELPKNIREQSVLTQLYILGNSLRREVQHTLAIRSMEVALIVYERMKLTSESEAEPSSQTNENESLKMKIHFVLAQSQQGSGKFEDAIENFKFSLSLALRAGDVSYETKTYLNLSTLCLDQDRYAEAASYYIRLLAVGQDVLSAVGEDESKFREHWSMEMEASILLNLCISFKSLRLYDEALEYAERYDRIIGLINAGPSPTPDLGRMQSFGEEFRPKSVPTFGFTESFFTQRSVDLSGMLQSKFILGDLYELRGDLDSAMKNYVDWMSMSEQLAKEFEGSDNPYILDTASALSCQGSVLMKKHQYLDALNCFKQQTQIVKMTKIPQLMMESALSRGDAFIELGRLEEARNVYNYAQKLSRNSMDDLEPECMCMWKIASVFAAEHRYTHAAYYCEQAVALARKCGKRSVQMKLNYELALYYQHSTSIKELEKAASVLFDMIKFQEEHISLHRMNGGKYFHEEERMLQKCYTAMQVILHKLDQPVWSVAFGEAWRRNSFLQMCDELPQIPNLPLSATSDKDPKQEVKEEENGTPAGVETPGVNLSKLDKFIPTKLENDAILVTYTLCDEGFLAHVLDPGVDVVKSYLSSKYDAKPYNTKPNIKRLVAKLGKVNSKDKTSTHLCNIYNSESRCLPGSHPSPTISLPAVGKEASPTITSMASGDQGKTKPQQPADKAEIGAGDVQTVDLKEKNVPLLAQLYEILVEPLVDVFANIKPGKHIVVTLDNDLKMIPFDSLVNPTTGRRLSERFNITTTPCCYVLHTPNVEFLVESSRLSTQPKSSANSPRSSKSPRPSSSRKELHQDVEIVEYRRNELMKSYGSENAVDSLELSGFSTSISRLVTETATGTNILTSPRYITSYKQASKKQKSSVIGCPSLPTALQCQGRIWMPKSKLPVALKECKKVAEYFDVIPILGEEATKKAFIEELTTSMVLHVATYADREKGTIAFAPDSFPCHEVIVNEDSYMFTLDDLHLLKLDQLKLLVLSCGHGWPNSPIKEERDIHDKEKRLLHLPELFLAAGVSTVLYQLWNVPDVVLEHFLFHFYDTLQSGNLVSKALNSAKDAVEKKYPDPVYWSGFILIGSDVFIDLSEVRRSQLHASLDFAGADSLDVKTEIEDVVKPDVAMNKLQKHFAYLAGSLALNPLNRDVVGALIELLEESMDRLTADSNTDRPVIILPDIISDNKGAVDLLIELGFDFQPADVPRPPPNTSDPSPFKAGQEVSAVVFPHWNKDGLLLPAHQALTGLQDICSSDIALQCLARILPLSQEMLCNLIDLLSVTRHTPEVQLRVYDDGVKSLWSVRYIKKYLIEIGFKQVHGLIVFFKTSRHRTLLIASLQAFASLCLHRDQGVLEQLNISSLGQPPKPETPKTKTELKTVQPVIMPRKEVILLSSWMQDPKSGEEKEIKKLSQRLTEAKSEYRRTLDHAKWWHKNLLTPQAQIKLSEIGLEKAPKPMKRKVKAGATPSCQRESADGEIDPHDKEPFFRTFAEAMRKRDYANYVAKKRYDQLEARYKAKVHEIYKEYAVNG